MGKSSIKRFNKKCRQIVYDSNIIKINIRRRIKMKQEQKGNVKNKMVKIVVPQLEKI